jgi:hypothetical protein
MIAFVIALQQRLPKMVLRALLQVCAQFKTVCWTLLEDLEGPGRVEVHAQVSAGIQVRFSYLLFGVWLFW